MPLYRTVAPETPVVSLSELKAHLRVDHVDEDSTIQTYGFAAVEWLEGGDGWLGRALHQQTWELRLDDFCGHEIRLPLPPLISVDSVQYYNSAGTLVTLSTSVYQVVGARGSQPACIALKDTQSWPTVARQKEAVIITFTAGYAVNSSPVEGTIPEPIRHAVKLLVGHMYANRESVMVGVTANELPMAFEALLSPYRVHYFG